MTKQKAMKILKLLEEFHRHEAKHYTELAESYTENDSLTRVVFMMAKHEKFDQEMLAEIIKHLKPKSA